MLKSLNKRYAILIIIVVSTVIYLGTLLNGFVLDDKYQVLANPWITDFSHIPEILTSTVWAFKESFATTDYYRPVMFLPYLVEYALFGFEPWGWHLVNIILHSLNGILVFLIASELMSMKAATGSSALVTGDPGLSADGARINAIIFPLASALLFAIHPVNSEVVSWVAGGTELSYTLFFLLSFYLYTLVEPRSGTVDHGGLNEQARRFSLVSPFYILSLVSFLVAVFSKEAAIVLPLFIIIYDYLRIDGKRELRRLRFKAYPAYFVVAAFYLLMRFHAIGQVVVHSLYSEDLLVLAANILPIAVEYLKLLFFPLKLTHYHFFIPAESLTEPMIIYSLIIIGIAVFVLYRLSRHIVAAPFLISLIIIPLIPTLYLLFFHDRNNPLAFYSERYLYLPSVGFSILVCSILMRFVLRGRRRRAYAVAIALLTLFLLGGVRTVARSFEWKNDLTIWASSIERFPQNYLAHFHYSDVYRESGDIQSALFELRESVRLEPDFKVSHLRLANLYYSIARGDEALIEFKEVLRIDPSNSVAYQSIGMIYMDWGRWSKAIEQLEMALSLASTTNQKVAIKNALGVSFARVGKMKRTRKELYEALELDPQNKETLQNIKFLDSMPPL